MKDNSRKAWVYDLNIYTLTGVQGAKIKLENIK